jgi:nucleotide-binding universal stress UspA family protein
MTTTDATGTTLDDAARTATSHHPTVLIAVDGAAGSVGIVRAAHRLFGDAATYLAINVGPGPYTQMSWAYVSPVGAASTWYPPLWLDDELDRGAINGTAAAEDEVRGIIADAGLRQATPLGEVGDPAPAIIGAAHHHHADVVVVGADTRSWFSRLVAGSVEREVLREADFAVLVVAEAQIAASATA